MLKMFSIIFLMIILSFGVYAGFYTWQSYTMPIDNPNLHFLDSADHGHPITRFYNGNFLTYSTTQKYSGNASIRMGGGTTNSNAFNVTTFTFNNKQAWVMKFRFYDTASYYTNNGEGLFVGFNDANWDWAADCGFGIMQGNQHSGYYQLIANNPYSSGVARTTGWHNITVLLNLSSTNCSLYIDDVYTTSLIIGVNMNNSKNVFFRASSLTDGYSYVDDLVMFAPQDTSTGISYPDLVITTSETNSMYQDLSINNSLFNDTHIGYNSTAIIYTNKTIENANISVWINNTLKNSLLTTITANNFTYILPNIFFSERNNLTYPINFRLNINSTILNHSMNYYMPFVSNATTTTSSETCILSCIDIKEGCFVKIENECTVISQ